VHIGDSTSVGLVSPQVVADPERRMEAQYHRVGVVDATVDASPGRSVIETLPGQRSGLAAAEQARAAGHRGCWVFALGTNDAANAAVGSNVALADRIDLLMGVAGDDPVLWVNAVSQRDDGEWSETEMERWNLALEAARSRHPNLAIDEWDDVAVDRADWFVADGIHYTSAGNEARAEHIADALVEAYPA
jgi:lysophospholipase L1-like esterase